MRRRERAVADRGDRDVGAAVQPALVLFGRERECAGERLRVEAQLLHPRELAVADDPAIGSTWPMYS